MKNIQKIGHRGAKGHLAENTLESIEKAIQLGVDMVEVDVHRCKTGELVVIHDFTLDRTTNGSGEIIQHSLKELKSFQVERDHKIPLLTEVLDTISGKCKINIELKGMNTAAETCRVIREYVEEKQWDYTDFIVSSFQQNELFQVFHINKKIPIGILSKANMKAALELGQKLNAISIHPSLGIVTRENIAQAQNLGFRVAVWTVNDLKSITRMKNFGVDGIISDFPERLADGISS